MTKITLTEVGNLRNETTGVEAINDNFDTLVDAIENTLSRDGTSPNTMEASLDMNSNRILNLPEAVADTEPIRKGDFDDAIEDIQAGTLVLPLAIASGGTGGATAAAARTNLGVTATGADTTYNFRANNLSDIASASTARTNLGLTALATTTPGTNVATFLTTPSSSNLAAALTDETGTGAAVFANTPTLVTPVLGAATGTSVVLTNAGNTARFVNSTDNASVQVARFEGDRATMADNDVAYNSYMLSNDLGTQSEFARHSWVAIDVNDGTSIDGRQAWSVAVAGVLTEVLQLRGSLNLVPASSGLLSLGTGSLPFSSIDLSSGSFIRFNNTDILTHSAGILTLNPGDLRVTTAGTNTASVVTVGGTQTLTNKTLTSPTIGTSPTAAGATWTNLGTVTTADINGGTLDGTIIGGASAAAGTFTTLTSTGTTTLGDAGADTIIMNAKSITKPNSCIVNAFNGTTITNVTGDGTSYQLLFGTESLDRGSDFSSPTFTSPVTGVYHISLNLVLLQVDALHTALSVTMVCTGKTYTLFSANAGALQVSGVVAITCGLGAVSLASSDTVTFSIVVSGGAAGKVVDYYGAADGTGSNCMFRLVG